MQLYKKLISNNFFFLERTHIEGEEKTNYERKAETRNPELQRLKVMVRKSCLYIYAISKGAEN